MEDDRPEFDYCTPDFLGFQTDFHDAADAIFRNQTNISEGINQQFKIKQERNSVLPEDPVELPNFDELIASVTIKKEPTVDRPLRRSISANHLDVRNVELAMEQMDINEGSNVTSMRQKSVENLRQKSSSRDNLYVNKKNCDTTIIKEKFMSVAERIYHMQNDTPKRFRSTMSRPDPKMVQAAMNRKRAQHMSRSTVPQSPALLSKSRLRPVTALSRQELEEKELEEIKKFHLKANPVPKYVLAGSHLAPVQRRPPTKFEAFNITEMKKKTIPNKEEFKFTAKPIPTAILERPVGVGKKTELPVTVPVTPKFMKAKSFDNGGNSIAVECDRLKSSRSDKSNVSDCGSSMNSASYRKFMEPLKPKPFSFEQRDRLRLEKKQQMINAVYEQEKRAREFKAQPVPAVIRKKLIVQSPKKQVENKENVCKPLIKFEAKPPLVLYKEPFKPVKTESPLTAMCPFNLATLKRAAEREIFDQKIREQDMLNEERRKQEEQERLQAEQREIAIMRSQQVHQANPIRYYPAVKAIKNAALTFPESPQFQFKKKQNLLLQSRNAELQLNQDATDYAKSGNNVGGKDAN